MRLPPVRSTLYMYFLGLTHLSSFCAQFRPLFGPPIFAHHAGTIATEGTAGLWGKMEASDDGKVNFQTEEAGEAGEDSFGNLTSNQEIYDRTQIGCL